MKILVYITLMLLGVTISAKAQIQTDKYRYLIDKWNNAHIDKEKAFPTIYNDTVYFYGEQIDGKDATRRKGIALAKDLSYSQKISDLRIIEVNDNYIQCYFDKTSISNGKTNKYPSFITWVKRENNWFIRSENDLYTEMAIAKYRYKMKVPSSYEKDVNWGDFIGDETIQCSWVEGANLINKDSWDDGCVGDCNSQVRFSRPNIPSITIDNCIWGDVLNLGDFNRNGTTELGIVPHWPTSCWSPFYVFTYIDNKWEQVFNPPITTNCMQFDDGMGFPVKPNESFDGKVRVTYTTTINMGTESEPDMDIKVKTKEIDTKDKKYNINIYDKEDYR